MDNARRTHENAVKRMERLTLSERFQKMETTELETTLSLLEKSFGDFTEQHQLLVVKLRDPAKYKLEDELYSHVQELYRRSVIRIRSKMDEVLRERALRSMARRSRENATEKVTEPKERSVDPQQQQRSYELKQRHQREVQRRDAIIHSHRTREWVNHLQESDNEEALERERVHINQQLAELE